MADTIPDIQMSNTEYLDINTLSGILSGSSLLLSNKSESTILLQVSISKPANSSMDGERLEAPPNRNSIREVTAGENTVWGKSVGENDAPISVQESA